jgi:hypothetical protein
MHYSYIELLERRRRAAREEEESLLRALSSAKGLICMRDYLGDMYACLWARCRARHMLLKRQ